MTFISNPFFVGAEFTTMPPDNYAPVLAAVALRVLRKMDGTGIATADDVAKYLNVGTKTVTSWENEPGRFDDSPCRNGAVLALASAWNALSDAGGFRHCGNGLGKDAVRLPPELASLKAMADSVKEWRAGVYFGVAPSYYDVVQTIWAAPWLQKYGPLILPRNVAIDLIAYYNPKAPRRHVAGPKPKEADFGRYTGTHADRRANAKGAA